ncbi:nucleoside diphosphate-linked moiety X motif 13 isoform X2 [Oncorhynchus nerka]|uniref:nucleoside diphosphate-linked moiety X motif 13 isoform X2 n=1 Tax=Oncorhynchus tshawytscha TaxID=74940 RepID=UPI000D09A4BC|nr:nucleoside diphosphate-linked moiety X motif 13 isoform X2 [Oncorhynchus tshawytscha]XP_029484922.1 nucleoside diphosphate-linked moiety X motif 13-like isoform X2 [Oncorhynchus nerka]
MLQPLRILFRPKWMVSRSSASYVSRMRHLNKIKEEDEACRAALQSGNIFLYHKLAPLLRRTDSGIYQLPALQTKDVEEILEKLGEDKEMVKESILINCTEQNEAQFSFDVGAIEQAAVEELCRGTFVDLRKAFFLLRGSEAPLVARGQALLRWHQTNGFCSSTGQPTQRNQSGSQRVCHSSGITYYPKMSPVVIVLVSDGKRCLLGRQSTFPRGMYSALAGFCDIGETMEEALRREIAEEVGLEVSVDKVELEDARWFSLEEVQEALTIKAPPRNNKGEPTVFWVPPSYAIANRLIQEWANQQHLKS